MTNRDRAEKIVDVEANAPLVLEIERALDEAEKRGFIEGQKEMRERAAKVAHETVLRDCYVRETSTEASVPRAIRSLPISTDGVREGEEK